VKGGRRSLPSPVSWNHPRNSVWCRSVRTGAQFSPLPSPDLRSQPPEHLGPDPQIYSPHLHPRDMEGSQTPGDLSWLYLGFQSPRPHAARVSSCFTKPRSSKLKEARASHGQECLCAAPSVHSFCGAVLEGFHVNAPYLVVESLHQFTYTILLRVSATK